jgi:predicted DNA-binding protein (UPF0251 family)
MRNRNKRKVNFDYRGIYYKPQGIPLSQLKEVKIHKEELETIRLRYIEKLSQKQAADKMGISQSQYQRDLVNTLEKITKAMISGDAINIPENK